ncbi:MAG: hypothetical protein MH204_03205, partial [Fimbriimonadaceae bacterium]|nr:hypothetical protein [Fimbriimonadaceae bacterium]
MHPASDSPPPPAPADRQLQALKDLVAHLSAQPMHDIRQAGELADRFGLDQTMVERILVDLDQPVQRSGVWENLWRIFSSAVLELARSLRSIVARWTDRPWPAILVSSAMAILALTLDVRLAAGPGSEGQRLFNNSALAVLALGSLVVQAITLARHGSQKLAVFSSGLIFVGLIHPMTVALRIQAPQGTGSIPILGIAASYALALTMAHLIFSSGISAIGAWARLQKAERRIRRLSRQEMLDRLFRLDRHLGEAVARKSGRRPGFKEWMRESRTFPAAGMALGVGFGLLEVALVGGALAAAGPSPGARAFLAQFLAALLTLIWLLACGGLAYASGSVMRGMIVGLSAAGIRMMIHSIPVQPYGLDQMVASLRDGRQVLQLGLLLLAATIAGAAGMVDRRQSRRERLASRDPASLAAEMVLL